MKKLRAGILGVGSIAHNHAHAIQQLHERIELVACCGRDETKTRALTEQSAAGRAFVFTNHAEMFERAKMG